MNPEKQLKPLFSREHIQARTREIAKKISADYTGRTPVMISILKGSFIFLADIIRDLTIDVGIEFVQISSYGSAKTSSGTCVLHKDISLDIKGREIIIVEDIVDSGNTLHFLMQHLAHRQAASIKVCALINKKIRREHHLNVDYFCFEVNDEFVVGYGLDHNEQFRNLSAIYELLD